MVTASIVSHGHAQMVARLVENFLPCPEISRIGITQNVAEDAEYQIVQDRSVSVMHDARRESRRSLRFAKWHLASMARYLFKTRRI